MGVNGIGLEGSDWLNLAQDRDQYRVVVNTAMILRGTNNAENLTS